MRERHDIVARPPVPSQAYVPAPYNLGPGLPPETPEPSLMAPILRQWWLVMLFILYPPDALYRSCRWPSPYS